MQSFMHRLAFEARGEARAELDLVAPATAGGSLADLVRVSGLAPAALRLEPCRPGVVVTATVPGVRVAGHAVPPGARRLLRPGERVEVGGAVLELLAAPPEGTRAAAGALLAGAAPPGPGLLVLSGPLAGARAPLRGPVVVGRGRSAGLRLPDAEISRRHARVRLRGGQAIVEDLGSKNGVRVNGVRTERRAVVLAPGDELTIGETALAFEEGGVAPASAPASASAPAPAGARAAAPVAALRGPGVRRLTAAALLLAVGAAALAVASAAG